MSAKTHPHALIAEAERRAKGGRLKHFAAALGVSIEEAARYWPLVQEIRAKRAARRERRPVPRAWGGDALRARLETRRWIAESEQQRAAEQERRRQRDERAAEIHATLLRAARVARSCGLRVRSSRDQDGRVSSYYVERESGRALRISDHEIPSNGRREAEAAAHGSFGYYGYPGPQLIIDRPRRAEWLRRAIRLSLANRSVEG